MGNRLILKFYFGAERLNEGLDRLIVSRAFSSKNCEQVAEEMIELIAFKEELAKLYNYLDGVMKGLTDKDRLSLEGFIKSRKRFSLYTYEEKREAKRVLIKLARHLRGIDRFKETLSAVEKFYARVYLN